MKLAVLILLIYSSSVFAEGSRYVSPMFYSVKQMPKLRNYIVDESNRRYPRSQQHPGSIDAALARNWINIEMTQFGKLMQGRMIPWNEKTHLRIISNLEAIVCREGVYCSYSSLVDAYWETVSLKEQLIYAEIRRILRDDPQERDRQILESRAQYGAYRATWSF